MPEDGGVIRIYPNCAPSTQWCGRGVMIARQFRGMALDELAKECSVTQMYLVAVEQEREDATDDLIASCVRLLDFPRGFFEREHHARDNLTTLFTCPPPRELDVCSYEGCGGSAEAECDAPIGRGKRCRLGLCADHRLMIREGVDVCEWHATAQGGEGKSDG